MKILFITDAWHPQINGVVRTLSTTGRELEKMGHTVEFIGPDRFKTMPLVGYAEIRVAVRPRRKLERLDVDDAEVSGVDVIRHDDEKARGERDKSECPHAGRLARDDGAFSADNGAEDERKRQFREHDDRRVHEFRGCVHTQILYH